MKSRLMFVAAVVVLAGCISPNPYRGGPAPVVDRSISDSPSGGGVYPNAGRGTATPGVEVTPLGESDPFASEQGLVLEDIPAPAPAGPPTIQRKPPSAAPAPAEQSNQAVIALLQSAETHVNNGELDRAASDLERAVRIDSNDALIWYDLGQIRLAQGNYGDAEAMAAKSNGLAGGDRSLQACNWSLIASARRSQNNLAGADAADAQAVQRGGCQR